MGDVYLARDPALDRSVAIKFLREGFDNQEMRERFEREARAAGRLSHPNIVTIYEFGEFERRPFIAILRRVWDFIPFIGDIWVPFIFHFDFVDTTTGATVMVSERQKEIRDRYWVTVPDPRLDFRVAASMAVALDALQSR